MSDSPKIRGTVHLVHGFNVRDGGKGSIAKLAPAFTSADFEVVTFAYGWLFLARVRFGTSKLARKLAASVRPGDIGVGHSNGCNLLNEAAWLGAPFAHLVYINPALDSDAALAPQVKSLDVWHSPSDAAVRVARVLWFHPWGDMGAVGYQGRPDSRIRSFNKERDFAVSSSGHSDVFAEGKVEYFAPRIVAALVEKISL